MKKIYNIKSIMQKYNCKEEQFRQKALEELTAENHQDLESFIEIT